MIYDISTKNIDKHILKKNFILLGSTKIDSICNM